MVSAYIKRLKHYSDIRFIFEISALIILSRYLFVIPLAIILGMIGVDLGKGNMEVYTTSGEPFSLFWELCIFGPFIETILLQWIPIKVFTLIRIPLHVQLVLLTLLFAFLHLDIGLINFIGTLPIGFLLVWSYLVRRQQSEWRAFWITFIIHALTNAFPFLLYLIDIFSS